MEKLFDEFDGVSLSEWMAKIMVDLKGKPIEALHTQPEMDLEIKAYHHPDDNAGSRNVYSRKNNNWKIRKAYTSEPNKVLLKDLNEGVTAVGLLHTPIFNSQSASILFEHIESDISLIEPVEDYSIFPATSHLNFDIFGHSLLTGKWMHDKSVFTDFYSASSSHKNLWISGSLYGDTGATSIQELAFTASHLNEYVHLLVESGQSLTDINQSICIELSVTDNYFVNIAKIRAIRALVRGIFEAYDSGHDHQAIKLYAKTSCRFLAENDANNNLLRETTQAMSAILGGCDVLTVQALFSSDNTVNAINQRMAKNIQLILKEESYFDKVVDPSQGSYFIESLTTTLLSKSWDLFKLLESQGGFCQTIEKGVIQDMIELNKDYMIKKLNSDENTFLGVNKFHSKLEEWKKSGPISNQKTQDFKALTPFRLESYYNQKVKA